MKKAFKTIAAVLICTVMMSGFALPAFAQSADETAVPETEALPEAPGGTEAQAEDPVSSPAFTSVHWIECTDAQITEKIAAAEPFVMMYCQKNAEIPAELAAALTQAMDEYGLTIYALDADAYALPEIFAQDPALALPAVYTLNADGTAEGIACADLPALTEFLMKFAPNAPAVEEPEEEPAEEPAAPDPEEIPADGAEEAPADDPAEVPAEEPSDTPAEEPPDPPLFNSANWIESTDAQIAEKIANGAPFVLFYYQKNAPMAAELGAFLTYYMDECGVTLYALDADAYALPEIFVQDPPLGIPAAYALNADGTAEGTDCSDLSALDEFLARFVPVMPETETAAVNPTAHSANDIKIYAANLGVNASWANASVSYTQTPSYSAPYRPGALGSSSRTQFISTVNLIRYVAGIDPITWDSSTESAAQAAAFISGMNGTISHTPSRPAGVSDALYELGYTGCSTSNLAAGFISPYQNVLGWMDDTGVPELGHRRWIINPQLSKSALGLSPRSPYASYYLGYGAMTVFDYNGRSVSNVAWPARQMPVELFGSGADWSFSTGSAIQNPGNVTVTLRRASDGRTWTFRQSSGNLIVDNSYYGTPGCLIFNPKAAYNPGDQYTVSITGIPSPTTYTVSFFKLFTGSGGSPEPAPDRAKTQEFVKRLYKTLLERDADPGGLKYYTDLLVNRKMTAAQMTATVALGEEFTKKNVSNSKYLDLMYQSMMGRAADASGKKYWQGFLDKGMSRKYIMQNFINSAEFTKICNSYGITRGSYTSDEPRDKNGNVTAFVQRLYQNCLNRKADAGGLNYWCGRLLAGEVTGMQTADFFFFSPEFVGRGYDNTAFVDRLYTTLMDRRPDASGKAYWIRRLNNGATRKTAVTQYADSQEYRNICAKYGIRHK